MKLSTFLLAMIAALGPAPAAAGLSKNAEARLDEGLRHLYNLDYDRSRETFRRLIEAEPESPFGYLFEAGAIWWQSDMEYGLFKDTPTLQGLFEADIDAAINKSQIMVKSKSAEERADGYFAGGMALGTRGQWSKLRGHWAQAYFDGKKAIKLLNKCVKVDPGYNDAYLGLGIFDYQVARFGVFLKVLAVIGLRGDEKRGLERMHRAMDKGRHASRQSAQFLSYIYLVDKHDYRRSLEVIGRLRRELPESSYYQLLEVLALQRTGDVSGSIREAKDLYSRSQSSPQAFQRKLLSLLCGLAAERCFEKETIVPARAWLTAAIEERAAPAANAHSKGGRGGSPAGLTAGGRDGSLAGPTLGDSWAPFTRLLRGYTSDLLGKRDEALKDYHAVLAAPDYADYHQRARDCQKRPCQASGLLQYLRALSRGEAWPPPARRRPPAP